MKEKILKIGMVLILVVMLFVLTGCGDTKKDDNDDKEESTSNSELSREEEKEIYNEARNEVEKDTNNLGNAEIVAFNEKFEAYEGKQNGNNLRTLFAQVISNNSTNTDNQVTVEYEGEELSTSQELSSARTKISSTKSYNVTLEYKNKLVEKIIIK